MQFRFYLLDLDDRILAGEHFSAADDTEALAIAALLWATCSDLCEDYDLWQGTRRVRGKWLERVHRRTADVAVTRQADIRDLEERLLEGFATLKPSAKLAKRVAEHRARVSRHSVADDASEGSET
jgi:hypothetical protein